MKYGTFRYGQYPYGPFELEAEPGAIGQDKIFRLTPLANLGLPIGNKILDTFHTIYAHADQIRLRSNLSEAVISQSISLDVEPTRFRIRSDKSDYLICEVGTLRSKS